LELRGLRVVVTLSAFGEKEHPPTDPELQKVLGRAYAAWN